ncbi:DUF7511 domain-containing protein [Halobacterium zhouii]|uniref:DUF7511 domain-containing protein n=1 Tax=Halobacterium zhouii TaxID=2902624 RepID=UPI001E4E38D0|nr:hypothetical protein [Halobacterium zhouii]
MTADSTTDGESSTDPADTTAAGHARPDSNRSKPSAYATDIDSLRAIVVRHRNRSDRCTVAPAEAAGEKRLTTWLSVDAAVIRSLREMR